MGAETPLVFPAEHEEVKAWLANVRNFSRGVMVLAGAVLAGVAQISERVLIDNGASLAAVGAVIMSVASVLVGFLIERMVFAEAQNRFHLIFGSESFGGSNRVARTWALRHFERGAPIAGKPGRDAMAHERIHHTASAFAGRPQDAKWMTWLQSSFWLSAATLYATALIRLLVK